MPPLTPCYTARDDAQAAASNGMPRSTTPSRQLGMASPRRSLDVLRELDVRPAARQHPFDCGACASAQAIGASFGGVLDAIGAIGAFA